MLESIRCNTCIHCHVCHAVAECTNTLYPCKDYEKNLPRGECRDRLKEVFREASEIGGNLFHLSQIERIIDGEDWL